MEGKEKEICRKLSEGIGMVGVYCVALPLCGPDPLEILSCVELKQRWHRRSDQLIVGFSGSKREAYLLSADILNTVHLKQGDYNTRSYFMQPEGKV